MVNRKLKPGILLFLLFIVSKINAQHFEWASTSSNLFSGFKGGVMDAKGNFVVAGEMPQLNYYSGGEALLYDSEGKGTKVTDYRSCLLVVSYTPEGKINWVNKIKQGETSSLETGGITADNKGNIFVLVKAESRIYISSAEDEEYGRGSTLSEKVDEDENDFDEEENESDDGDEEENYPGAYVVVCLNTQGHPQWIRRDLANIIDDVTSFEVSPLGGFVFAGTTEKSIKTVNGIAKAGKGGSNYVLKTDDRLNAQWADIVQYHSTTCCTYQIPSCKAKVAADGTVYTVGTYRFGGTFSDKSSHKAVIVDSVWQYNEPYESYLASISKDGKLNWVKRAGSKAIFSAITVTKDGIYISGRLHAGNNVFGQKPDTTKGKRMLLAGFNLKGQCKWVKTNNGNTGNSLVADASNNIYVSVESNLADPKNPLILEEDTIKRSYSSLIVASYDKDGNYRWYKMSNVMMSSNEFPTLAIDNCGNIFIAGEMWYVLKVQTSWFDAAFVKGDGYGAAPLVAKLKNSIQLTENLSGDKKSTTKGNVKTESQGFCTISPGPWQLMNFPNPFSGKTTLRLSTTYSDKNIQMQVFSLKGQLISTVFNNKSLDAGQHDFTFDAQVNNLSAGVYVVVVKGSQTVASTEIVVQK